jgi:hypothetical protein
MDQLTRWAPSPPDLLDRERRGRRRRNWRRTIIAMVALLVVMPFVLLFVSVERSQPLSTDGLSSSVALARVVDSFDAVAPGGESFHQYKVGGTLGDPFWYGFTLTNQGLLPLRVLSIGRPPMPGDVFPLPQTGVRMGPETGPDQFLAKSATTFHPFTLGHDEYRFIVVDARLDHCRRTGGIFYYGTVDVRYQVVGVIHQERTITLPYTMQVSARACRAPQHAGETGGAQTP